MHPDKLNLAARMIIQQLFSWDSVEELWELQLPFPRKVSAVLNNYENVDISIRQIESIIGPNELIDVEGFKLERDTLTLTVKHSA